MNLHHLTDKERVAYERGVQRAKGEVTTLETPECGAYGSHMDMPCGCCWHTPSHCVEGKLGQVCPNNEFEVEGRSC